MFEFLAVFALLLGILRFAGVTSIAFQAVAHIFVAFNFTAAYYDAKNRWKFLGLGLALTAAEVVAFFALR